MADQEVTWKSIEPHDLDYLHAAASVAEKPIADVLGAMAELSRRLHAFENRTILSAGYYTSQLSQVAVRHKSGSACHAGHRQLNGIAS